MVTDFCRLVEDDVSGMGCGGNLRRNDPREFPEPLEDDAAVRRIDLDAEASPSCLFGGDERGAGTEEVIVDGIADPGTVEVQAITATKVSHGEQVFKLGEEKTFGDYTITLTEVTPAKEAEVTIPESAYGLRS